MLCAFGSDGVQKYTRIRLVQAECIYVQFEQLVFLLKFAVGGYKQSREGRNSQVSRLCERVCVDRFLPLSVAPFNPFIVQEDREGRIQGRGKGQKRIK